MLYAGVDAHKKYSKVVLTDDHGAQLAQASLSNDLGCFQEFFSQATEPVKAVVESGRTWGVIGASHRELDPKLSTDHQPVQAHRKEEKLKPGEIVPVDIEIWPHSRFWHKG
jgi:hypothetical protein